MSDGDDPVIATGNLQNNGPVYDISGRFNNENVVMCVEPWPSGLKVMVVEGNCVSLLLTQQLLHQCNYNVVCCRNVSEAISFVTEDHHGFDLIISDIFLPTEDGLVLLNTIISLHLDISVVMMSYRGDPNLAMKYIANGACEFLTKPLTLKEMKNIWQPVFRRKMQNHVNVADELLHNNNNRKRGSSYHCSISMDENESEEVIDDVRNLKKSRLHWSRQLHLQFVEAVNALGVDKAVPRRILEVMKVRELSREHVASHLQKYRLHLKKLSSPSSESGSGTSTSAITNLQQALRIEGTTTNTDTNLEETMY